MGKAIPLDPNIRTCRNRRAELDPGELIADAIEGDGRGCIALAASAVLRARIALWEKTNVAAGRQEKQSEYRMNLAHRECRDGAEARQGRPSFWWGSLYDAPSHRCAMRHCHREDGGFFSRMKMR